jgi:protein-S-isoprenylcysteine O-methyltransferase Ste14
MERLGMTRSGIWLALRSTFWAAAMPGVVAGYVPWRFFGLRRLVFDPARPGQLAGAIVAAAGVALLGACVWQFAREGRGTLIPVDAPTQLVVRGLYRHVRNPMYLSVSAMLLGEALAAWSGAILIYWAAYFGFVNLFIIGYEEPALRARFGASYERYTRQVGRWLPRLRR